MPITDVGTGSETDHHARRKHHQQCHDLGQSQQTRVLLLLSSSFFPSRLSPSHPPHPTLLILSLSLSLFKHTHSPHHDAARDHQPSIANSTNHQQCPPRRLLDLDPLDNRGGSDQTKGHQSVLLCRGRMDNRSQMLSCRKSLSLSLFAVFGKALVIIATRLHAPFAFLPITLA